MITICANPPGDEEVQKIDHSLQSRRRVVNVVVGYQSVGELLARGIVGACDRCLLVPLGATQVLLHRREHPGLPSSCSCDPCMMTGGWWASFR